MSFETPFRRVGGHFLFVPSSHFRDVLAEEGYRSCRAVPGFIGHSLGATRRKEA